jgi:hypothetical protein
MMHHAFIPIGEKMPTVKVKVTDGEIWSLKDPDYREMSMIQFYTEYRIKWVADQITEHFKGGALPKETVAGCGDELALMFEKETGKPQWPRVGQIVAEHFPDTLPPDDGRRDVGQWIYNLVKRRRDRQRRKHGSAVEENVSLNNAEC